MVDDILGAVFECAEDLAIFGAAGWLVLVVLAAGLCFYFGSQAALADVQKCQVVHAPCTVTTDRGFLGMSVKHLAQTSEAAAPAAPAAAK